MVKPRTPSKRDLGSFFGGKPVEAESNRCHDRPPLIGPRWIGRFTGVARAVVFTTAVYLASCLLFLMYFAWWPRG
jgi:hypothetical protein